MCMCADVCGCMWMRVCVCAGVPGVSCLCERESKIMSLIRRYLDQPVCVACDVCVVCRLSCVCVYVYECVCVYVYVSC
jgi:hypothetical protein